MNKDSYRSPNIFLIVLILLSASCFGIYFSLHPARVSIPSITGIVFSQHGSIPTPPATISGRLAYVLYVVDGDTIDVMLDDKDMRVRFIGVNAPERYEGKDPECFANEAGTYVKNRLEKKQVYLVSDPSQDDTDKYGRLLRYIFLEDGTNVDLELVQKGYAREYTYKIPYRYQQEFRDAQRIAKSGNRGLWGYCDE